MVRNEELSRTPPSIVSSGTLTHLNLCTQLRILKKFPILFIPGCIWRTRSQGGTGKSSVWLAVLGICHFTRAGLAGLWAWCHDDSSQLFSVCCIVRENNNGVWCAAKVFSYAGANGCFLCCAVLFLWRVWPCLSGLPNFIQMTDFQSHKITF